MFPLERCDRDWKYCAFEGHSSYEAIDLNYGAGADDEGQWIVASAGGQATVRGSRSDGYGHYVNGGGHITRHAHLKAGTAVGGTVEAGDRIGQLGGSGESGGSGGYSPHLHYEQRHEGQAAHISFGGRRITYSEERIDVPDWCV